MQNLPKLIENLQTVLAAVAGGRNVSSMDSVSAILKLPKDGTAHTSTHVLLFTCIVYPYGVYGLVSRQRSVRESMLTFLHWFFGLLLSNSDATSQQIKTQSLVPLQPMRAVKREYLEAYSIHTVLSNKGKPKLSGQLTLAQTLTGSLSSRGLGEFLYVALNETESAQTTDACLGLLEVIPPPPIYK